jgi:hypothetical protein
MTVNRGPGVTKNGAVGTTTIEHRLQLAGQYAENSPGVPRTGVLAQPTATLVVPRADMSWDISPLQAVINRTASEGVYTPTLTGTTNVPTIAAPATDSRWDLVYIKQNDVAKGDADNLAVADVVNGTAAASPSKPYGSLPAGALVLAESRIFATTTGTSGGSNTTAQVWRHTAARGATITMRNVAERNEITAPTKGQKVLRLDLTGLQEEVWSGTAWTPPPGAQGMTLRKKITANGIGLTGLSVVENFATYDFKAGRKYRIVWQGGYSMSATGNYFDLAIHTASTADAAGLTTGLTQLMSRTYTANASGAGESFYVEAIYEPSADETKQVKFTINRTIGAGTWALQAAASAPAYYYIEDQGAQF